MGSLRVAIVVFAVVVSLFSSTTNGELITKCIVAYAQECPDQTSSAGIERCCSLMVNMYKNDADCLCSIYEYTSTDDETANDKLFECGINTNDSFSCNSDRDRSLLGNSSFVTSPSSAPASPSSTESPSSAKSPEIEKSAGYKKNAIKGISGIMSLAFLSFLVVFIVA